MLGTDPRSPEPGSPASDALRGRVEGEGGAARMIVTLMRAAAATDVELEVQTADHPGGPWTISAAQAAVGDPVDGRVVVRWTDPRPVALAAGSFYRIAPRLCGSNPANFTKLTN